MQVIMSGVWTKLLDHDVELFQNSGVYIAVYVQRGQLYTEPPSAEVKLRAPGGVYPKGWRAPLTGCYQFGGGPDPDRVTSLHMVTLTLDDVVLEDAQCLETEHGTMYAGPALAMDSGEPLNTDQASAGLQAEWRSE